MSYIDLLERKAKECGNILCMGIDPDIEKIPGGKIYDITRFYFDIFDGIEKNEIKIPSFKPNIAFFEQYGPEGLKSLKQIIQRIRLMGSHIILDAKRGDIGNTAKAYAKSIFMYWEADSTTLQPYLGKDSIIPFLEFNNKGSYVLCRTSNKSAREFQDITQNGKKIFEHVAEKIMGDWYHEGIGAVVGATYPDELEKLSKMFVDSKKKIPLLIPGVGSQGASAKEVMEILKKTKNPLWLHRVNSSSAISYAYLKEGSDDHVGCAISEIKRLIHELKI